VSASSRTALGDIELLPVCRPCQALIVPLQCLWHRAVAAAIMIAGRHRYDPVRRPGAPSWRSSRL